jgi:hypothetical protein
MLIAAILTAAGALIAFALALVFLFPREERRLALVCYAATVPMCYLALHYVRMPLDGLLVGQLGKKSELLWWIRSAYAPLTEEPAKLWPLLLPFVRRHITRENVARFALALGMGFAMGEIFTVAGLISASQPKIAALPWYELSGFIMERWVTCLVHPGMTALALVGWRRGPGFIPGLLAAMLAHYLVNIPIGFAQRGWLGKNAAITQAALSLWVMGAGVLALMSLAWLHFGRTSLGALVFGRADCPECGQEYDRGFFTGLNMGGSRRYERCPHCRRWHWTNAKPKSAPAAARA